MHLYVDGIQVGSNAATGAQAFTGYWRVGGDSSWGGDSGYFAGTIDEVAVYSYELTQQTVAAHFTAAGGTVANQPPTASFTNSAAGLNASFNASGSGDTDGTIVSYAWDFGDGTQGSGISPNHTYNATGDYTVKLTVTDDDGATGTSSQTIHVDDAAPTATFTSSTSDLTVSADGSGSSDSDGTVASYDWNWGDGSADDSGATPTHTYAHSGTYTVTLTVTDNAGGTGTSTAQVQPSHNNPPTASFTNTAAGLNASFDGSGSSDSDGTIASYAWDFGDGSQASGISPNHTYNATGDYTVSLTVKDDGGATDTDTQTVHVTDANPTAAFTSTTNQLTVSADGSGSSDSDGTVASYDWNWGDGSADDSGVSPSHTFAASGTYPVTLTVTDNAGGTATVEHDVMVSNAAPTLIASDDFGRTATKGWGNADLGGAWTTTGTKTNFAVSGGSGKISVAQAPGGPSVNLNSVSTSNADIRVKVSPEQVANGNGSYVSVLGRTVDTSGSYRAVVNLLANGSVTLSLTRVDTAGTAKIAGPVTISGLTYTAGTVLDVRMAVVGTNPTQLMAKVWKDGTTEPATWQVSGVDSAPGMQAAGTVGLMNYLSGTSTNAPNTADFSSLRVYNSTAQQVMGNMLKRQLATEKTTHKSRRIPAAKRTSLPFTRITER
jgi:PKD repeat protein